MNSRVAALLALGALCPAAARGATPSPAPSAAPAAASLTALTPQQQQALQLAIIKTSQNPVGNITIVPFQNNFNYGYGPYARFQYNLNVQPVIPIMLAPQMTLIARTILPLFNQPSSAPPSVCASGFGCPSTFGLGDVQEQLFFAPKTKPGALIWGVGPIFQFPAASPGTLGAGKWAAGPDAVALVMPSNWVIGALLTQLWSYAGQTNRAAVNSFLVQPFINYNIKGGWAISTAPTITANWTAAQNKWAVPVGGGISRTFKDDGQLMSLAIVYYTYVVRPVAAPQTNLKITWSLLWPVKRGIDVQQLLTQGGASP